METVSVVRFNTRALLEGSLSDRICREDLNVVGWDKAITRGLKLVSEMTVDEFENALNDVVEQMAWYVEGYAEAIEEAKV